MQPAIVFLMYHELELPNRALCQPEPGYIRYVLRARDFQAQVQSLRLGGLQGWSVGEALAFPSPSGVAITFDDGCETDLLCAAPVLKEANFGATFYITAGFLNRPGYLSAKQLQELAELGFEVGCHSMTHPYLSDLDAAALAQEIVVPKLKLEQIAGRAVRHFSCPGGRWSERVKEVARDAGYESVSTSRNCANSRGRDRYSLGRVAIMRDTGLTRFEDICHARGLWRLQLQDVARSGLKRLLGTSGYDRVRAVLLNDKQIPNNPGH
jgi:hypothetical protein